ncbi:proline-, glutamic acid- and leucine-rich protein 1 isoform X2 [Salminus brasiliensis]|uniref:proline-, glutamic acid- and leucine-rich protein 1 isoform X2 n=1 Tax=Salminus brasiliensis TaxID=930266 RepID=UPI003B82CCAD
MATAAWLHGQSPNNARLTEGLVSALKEERPEFLPALLSNYREHGAVGAQNSGTVGGLVGISNARLASSKTRFEGLCLLSMLVKDSSSEVFQQHCLSWLRSLQQIIQSQAPLPSVQLAVGVLQDLLQYSSQLPELAREVGLNSILGILTSLLGLKSECHLAAMEGMMACMIYYPRACGSLKEKLGVYFLSKLDSDHPKVQEVASECYGRLACLGGVLERGGGGRRAEGWTNQLHCLLASANSILGQLYQGVETETIQYDGPGLELPFPPLDDIDPLLVLQLRQRYRAVCLALKHTLSFDPATSVRLPIQHVLNLVCRALAVSTKSINVTGEGCLKLLVLPSIHSDSLELLSSLIKVVGGGLVQYCSVITRLFSQSLSAWTPLPEASLGQQRAYSAVRVAIYHTLELWVRVGGASASVLQGSTSHSEVLFAHLMGDITPGTEAVKLRAGPTSISDLVGAAGKAGPRRTKGLGIGDSGVVSLQRKGDALANQDTCLAALRALRQIILTSGTLLKEDLHKRLQDLVVPLCVRLQQQAQCGSEVGVASGQYGSAAPRRELYRLLLALVLVPSPCWPPPLSCAVSAFSQGRRDRHVTVSSFCTEALTICNTLLHPRTPSISLSLPPLSLKPSPAAPVLSATQNPSLSLPTLLGGPAPGPSFPSRHPLGLGPAALLGSLDNHLPLAPPALPTPTGATGVQADLLLSPAQPAELAGLAAPEGQRQVFVRYDKEEAEDVEISLESDSDDSVVIMPQGMMLEMQEGVANAQTLPPPPGGAMTTPTEAGTVDTALPNELPTSISHQILPTDANNINSFPGPSQTDQLVSLVPPLNSTSVSLAASPGGLGNSLPAGPQLQQMLMQPSPGGQPAQLGLSLHMQLQSQLAQTSRQLQQPAAAEKDQNVININSSDDEEEEDEEMEDEDELGEEEEEEEGLEEDEEEEEGSDFPEDEEYAGEEYDDFEEEEGEEIDEEEEDEEEEEIQPLEGENRRAVMGGEEGEVMIEEQEERRMDAFHMEQEGQVEAGIEEMEGVRSVYGEEGMKDKVAVEEIENIGAVERNESEPVETQLETHVIVEEAEEEQAANASAAEPEQEARPWSQEGTRQEPEPAVPEASGAPQESQEATAEVEVTEQSTEAEKEDAPNQSTASTSEDIAPQQVEEAAEKDEGQQGEGKPPQQQQQQEEEVEDKEARGTKRKIEDREGEGSEQGSEKKKIDDEAMASMLADFVDCPPDDEDHGASQSRS